MLVWTIAELVINYLEVSELLDILKCKGHNKKDI